MKFPKMSSFPGSGWIKKYQEHRVEKKKVNEIRKFQESLTPEYHQTVSRVLRGMDYKEDQKMTLTVYDFDRNQRRLNHMIAQGPDISRCDKKPRHIETYLP